MDTTTTKVKRTPGPWYASAVKSNFGVFHVSASNGTGVANAFEWQDAKLIALAPELVTALEVAAAYLKAGSAQKAENVILQALLRVQL